MHHIARIFIVLSAVALLASTASAKDGFDFKSETFDLPTGERTFTGPGADPVNNNCLTCHSAGMVTVQPKLSKETWQGIVKKMINVYKAPVPDADVAPIVDYLSKHASAGK